MKCLMKKFAKISIAVILLMIIGCSNSPSPDNDLASGIILGDIGEVQKALDRGANVNLQYRDGTTPLMSACKKYTHHHGEADAQAAVEVKVDLKDKNSKTAKSRTSVAVKELTAHAAHASKAVSGNLAIVELLIASGADVNAKGKEGQTALSLAVQNDMPDIAEFLRQAGARE